MSGSISSELSIVTPSAELPFELDGNEVEEQVLKALQENVRSFADRMVKDIFLGPLAVNGTDATIAAIPVR